MCCLCVFEKYFFDNFIQYRQSDHKPLAAEWALSAAESRLFLEWALSTRKVCDELLSLDLYATVRVFA